MPSLRLPSRPRSTSRGWTAALGFAGLVLCSAFPSLVSAQLPQTRLYAVYPPGTKVGSTLDVTITNGADLDEVSRLLFSHPGITATQKQQDVAGKPQPVANAFTVTVAGDVPSGQYEVRAVGLFGISNPRTFVVGHRPELVETEPNNTREQATALPLDQTVNAKMNGATDLDFYKFTAQAGQRLIGECLARRIDSRFDGTLEVYDANGRRLMATRNNVARDPLLDFTAPATGDYFLRVHDFVFAGGEDYAYRLTLHPGPYVDYVWPPAGVPGTTGTFVLYGRNLPNGQPSGLAAYGKPLQKLDVPLAIPADGAGLETQFGWSSSFASADGFAYALPTPAGPSNPVLVGFATAPVVLEVEPNNVAAQSQKIPAPGEYAGQFQVKGDVDLYQFEAKAGSVFWIEVTGQRAGSGSDPYLTIDQVTVNDKGEETLKRIGNPIDDEGTNLLPNVFDTLHDDPIVKFAVPADGTYRLAVRDRYGSNRGDPTLLYRLTIRPEKPDFRVVVLPIGPTPPPQKTATTWSVGLRRGDQFPVQVLAVRKDGFAGPIDVVVEGLPAGVTCKDISVGTTPSTGTLVFTAADDTPAWAGTVRIIAKAKVDDPAKVAAVTAAQAVLKTTQDALAAAEKAIAKPAEDLQKANEALAAAKAELANKPDDEALKKKVAEAEAKVATAITAHQQVVQARDAAQAKLTEATTASQQAEAARVAAVQEVTHPGRVGTIVWSGQPNIPGETRLSAGLELSVVEEPAPFSITTDVHRVVANHGRQILVPVALAKRNGFDANVNITFAGTPANVQVENKPIDKDKAAEVYRIFVPPNAAVGTYVLNLVGQAQVAYRRNPQKADRLKAEFDVADKTATAAVETQKATVTKRDESNKLLEAAQAEQKKTTEAKTAADKALADAQAAEKAAQEAVKNAGDNADAKAAAEKQLTDAQTAVKTATENQQNTEKVRVAAEAALKTADDAKKAADLEVTKADEAVKATAAAKAAAEKLFKDAENASKPQNLNFIPTTSPIVLTIKAAPYTFTANPADGGAIKQGQKIEVKVDVKRQNGFAGPVTLTLPLPPGVVGIKADPVVVPADQTAGTLVIEAAADAPEATLANMVVRAVSEFDGEAAVDTPVTLKVVKP